MIKKVVTIALFSLSLTMFGCGDADDGGSGGSKPAPTDDVDDNTDTKEPAAKKGGEKKEPAGKKPSAKKPGAEEPGAEKPADDVADDQGGDGNEPVDDRPVCVIAWDDYRDDNEVGDFLKYKTVTLSNFGGFSSETESAMHQEVIANEADSVTWKYTTETNGQTFDSESQILKVDFITGCENTEEEEPEAEGDESIDVPAGSFDTHWLRYRRDVNNGESVSTSYMHELNSGESILIKSLTNTTLDNDEMSSNMELVETNKE